jgi:hypothetical protein
LTDSERQEVRELFRRYVNEKPEVQGVGVPKAVAEPPVPSPGEIAEQDGSSPTPGPERGKGRNM